MKNSNGGFTLVELLATIAATSIVTLAAMSFLLVCFRLCASAQATAGEQETSRIVLTLMEDLVSEGSITKVENTGSQWNLCGKKDNDDVVLLTYSGDDHTLSAGGSVIMEGVEDFSAALDNVNKKLLTITLKTENGKEYTTSVYCRTTEINDDPTKPASFNFNTGIVGRVYGRSSAAGAANARAYGISNDEWIARLALIANLDLQIGSTGKILSGDDEGKYFSEWYIGGYDAAHPGWSKNTPWCACFVSWGIAQVRDSLDRTLSFSDVDAGVKRLRSGENGAWLDPGAAPIPGDLIFFDWDEDPDPDYDSAADHVGVFLMQRDGRVYSIEGNTDGRVAVRNYAPDDPRILGYGRLKWKSSSGAD